MKYSRAGLLWVVGSMILAAPAGCGDSEGGDTGSATPACTPGDCEPCQDDCVKSCQCLTGEPEAACEMTCGLGAGGVGGSGGAGGDGGVAGAPTAQECFAEIYDGLIYVNYEQFDPVIGSHCSGTNHQDIQGVERIVYLGDSIMKGTPPTPPAQFVREQITAQIAGPLGNPEIAECSKWGARNDDLMTQLDMCAPVGGTQKTLFVVISGGNDLAAMAKDKLDPTAAQPEIDSMLGHLDTALDHMLDPANYPGGSYVVFANVYEFTDTSADMSSCPTGALAGFTGQWLSGAQTVVKINESYMRLATEKKVDMVFMSEDFCGHGFKKDDPTLQCYRGPDTPIWFDFTCIHPNPDGHTHLATQFAHTINE